MAEPRRTPVPILVVLAVLALGAALFYQKNPLNRSAQTYAQSVALASAGVYVTLRSLNAFLSAAQEVEVGGSLVVSGTLQPLKSLEPVDDTIERISGIIFTLMVVTGVLTVAMGPVSAIGALMMSVALGLWIVDRLIGRRDAVVVLAQRLIWYGAFLAVALPLAFVMSSLVADPLTDDVWNDNMAVVHDITAVTSEQQAEGPDAENDGVWSGLDGLGAFRDQAARYAALATNIYDNADELIGSYLAILAVFLFKLFILPTLLMGAFFLVFRFLAHAPSRPAT